MLNTEVKKLHKIQSLLEEILEEKPTYGDTDWDVTRLRGRQDLAEEILKIIKA